MRGIVPFAVVAVVGALCWGAGTALRRPAPAPRVDPLPACEDQAALQAEVDALREELTRPLQARLDLQARRGRASPPGPENVPPRWVYEPDAVWAALRELPGACRPRVRVRGTVCDARDGCGVVLDGILNVRRMGMEGTPPRCAEVWERVTAVYGSRVEISGGSTTCADGLTATAYRLTPRDLHLPPGLIPMPDCHGRTIEVCREGLEAARPTLQPGYLPAVEAAFDDNDAMVRRWGCGV